MMCFDDFYQFSKSERDGLVVERQTPEREVGGSILTQISMLCPGARYIYLPKVLVIPRKRRLRSNMTEKLFTGMLSKNETKRKFSKKSLDVLLLIRITNTDCWSLS